MIKWIGAALIIAGCGGFGFVMAWNYRREEAELRQLISILDYILCELEFRRTPLPVLFRKVGEGGTGILRQLFLDLAAEMEAQISVNASGCMDAVLSKNGRITPGCRKLLEKMGQSLGVFNLTGQLKEIEAIKKQCELKWEDMQKNRESRLRCYQTLGLCAGAALAILFV